MKKCWRQGERVRMALPFEQSQKMISGLRAEGRLLNSLSSRQLFDYLQFATKRVLEAGYKGLLILPDEFELFKNNPDTAQNYQQLKGFILIFMRKRIFQSDVSC